MNVSSKVKDTANTSVCLFNVQYISQQIHIRVWLIPHRDNVCIVW